MPKTTRLPATQAQPKIWIDDKQGPRFDLRAFLTVSTAITCRDLGPAVSASAASVQRFGQKLTERSYKVRLGWLGKAARLVPRQETIGAAVTGFGHVLHAASALILPQPDPEPDAYPNLIRPDVAKKPDHPAYPHRRSDESTLRSIRAIITAPEPPAPVPEPRPQRRPVAKMALQSVTARMLSWLLTAAAFPIGATKALQYHLNGGDLRDWN